MPTLLLEDSPMQLAQIAAAVHGKIVPPTATASINSVSIDTRTLQKGDLYIAIKGDNFDGHQFIASAQSAGASAAMVETPQTTSLAQIVVDNTRTALMQLAKAWKAALTVKTVAITGSNGKTTVKEMLAAILAIEAKVLATCGNLNNEIGVPLTLLKLQPTHRYAVIEIGANHQGEIARSCQAVRPDIAVITNIGSAHLEGFGTIAQVAAAKAEIVQSLSSDGVAVLNADDDFYQELRAHSAGKIVSFGVKKSADFGGKIIKTSSQWVNDFILCNAGASIAVCLQLFGSHNIANALAAAACARQLGISFAQIKQGLESTAAYTGRLQPRRGKHGGLVLDDSYNANPSSVQTALQVLQDLGGKSWVVLGDMGEMGAESCQIHHDLGRQIKSAGCERLFAVGKDSKHSCTAFGEGAQFFASQQELCECLVPKLTGVESILVKGAREQKMENIVRQIVNLEA